MRHFLDIKDFDKKRLSALLDTAHDMKSGNYVGRPLGGRHIGMIFEKPSTRTRVSFEVGISQLGGTPVFLAASDLQLGRGETVSDTAKVLSRYLDCLIIRAMTHDTLTELVEHATVPVINGLTDQSHPCQILADLQTVIEHHGSLKDEVIVWFGDGNNVANSWIEAAALFGFELRLAAPEVYHPSAQLIAWARGKGANIVITRDAQDAARHASVLVTDVWVSMGDDEGTRFEDFRPFQVTQRLLNLAHPDALFLHCLPAVREQEVTSEVIDGPQSVVFDEAENRLHAQKAIMAHLFEDNF